MNPTNIKWVKNPDGSQGYTSNPVKGICPIRCTYCYAQKIYQRFKWNPEIRFDVAELVAIGKHKKPAGIFLGSTFEIFWDGLERFWLDSIFATIRGCPQHRFYLLTKCPQHLIKFSPFPKNCWVGISVTNTNMLWEARKILPGIEASIKFISFEPLLEKIEGPILRYLSVIANWVIIGGQSGSKKFLPPGEWIQEIEDACSQVRIPVFEKDNLRRASVVIRQEIPDLSEIQSEPGK